MARTIKTYPEREDWKEALEVTSDSLKHIGPPHVALKLYSQASNRFDRIKTLDIKLETKEKEPGVKIYGEGKLLREIDESEFFDHVCDEIDSTTRAFYSLPYVSNIIQNVKDQIAMSLFEEEGTLSAPLKRNGLGFILSGKSPIAGIGTLDISPDGIIQFKNCVNAYDLSTVKDAHIVFTSYSQFIEVIPEGKVDCHSADGMCSYEMENAIMTPLVEGASEISLLNQAGFAYDGQDDEKFADEVVAFINSQSNEELLDVDIDDFDFD